MTDSRVVTAHFIGVARPGTSGVPTIPIGRLEAALHRFGGTVQGVERDNARLVRVLAGAAPVSPAGEGPIVAVAGEALTGEEEASVWLDVSRDGPGVLARANGQFAAAVLSHDVVQLVSDPLGVRPLFYSIVDGQVAFSTSLQALKHLLGPQPADPLGTWESLTFGFPLGDRSCWQAIRLVPMGTVLRISSGGVEELRYRELADEDWSAASTGELVEEFGHRFRRAVERRLPGDDGPSVAFLSGGMDSRAIVACLRGVGRDVVTLNVAPGGTLDAELGAMAGEALGADHRRFEFDDAARLSVWQRRSLTELRADGSIADAPRPRVWCGDGGSVLAGCVYLSEALIEIAEAGDWRETARSFMVATGHQLPHRLVAGNRRRAAEEALFESVGDAMSAEASRGGGEALYRFLLGADQRRHLHGYFSSAGVEDFEPILPFFDTEFVDFLASVPIEAKLNHRLYHEWFTSGALGAAPDVAWQTYPGHIPCPLPMPDGLRYQWGGGWYSASQRWRLAVTETRSALGFLMGSWAPRDLLNGPFATLALVSNVIGSRRWSHVPRSLLSVSEN
ncbi:MAG: asparagine synthase-related protein [Gemmatimonadota bacterium]